MWFDAVMHRRVSLLAATALLAVATAAACGGDDGSGGSGDAGGTLTVYAAASLTATFEQIGDEFEQQHDGVEVEFSFGGSSDLVTQIQEGAPADVFASADTANMDKLTAEDLQADDPQDFASNTLEIAVPPDNPAGITSFADLGDRRAERGRLRARGAVRRCDPEGRGRHRRQPSRRSARSSPSPTCSAKVTSGEADAGLVYVDRRHGRRRRRAGRHLPRVRPRP